MILENALTLLKDIVLENRDFLQSYHRLTEKPGFPMSEKASLQRGMLSLFGSYQKLTFTLENLFTRFIKDTPAYLLNLACFSLMKSHTAMASELQKPYLSLAMGLAIPKADDVFHTLAEESQKPFRFDASLMKDPAVNMMLTYEVPLAVARELLSRYPLEKANAIASHIHDKPHRFYAGSALADGKDSQGRTLSAIHFASGQVLYECRDVLPKEDLVSHRYFPLPYPRALMEADLSLSPLNEKILYADDQDVLKALSLACYLEDGYENTVTALYSDRPTYLFVRDKLKDPLKLDCLDLLAMDNVMAKTERAQNSYDVAIVTHPKADIGFAGLRPWLLCFHDPLRDEADHRSLKDLEDVSYFVKPGGILAFYSNSYLLSETSDIVESFLGRHPGFEKVMENTILPMEARSTAGYYAYLKRRKTK